MSLTGGLSYNKNSPKMTRHFTFTQLFLDCWYYLDPIGRLQRSGAKVGQEVFIGRHTYVELENASLLTIEDRVVLAAHTKIILHDSSLNNITGAPIRYAPVVLRHQCYIGANTTILPGSEVGQSTIVGANSLVKGTLKPHSVYVGQPAKYLCSIKDLERRWRSKSQRSGLSH